MAPSSCFKAPVVAPSTVVISIVPTMQHQHINWREIVYNLFKTQEYFTNHVGILYESAHFYRKIVGNRREKKNPTLRALVSCHGCMYACCSKMSSSRTQLVYENSSACYKRIVQNKRLPPSQRNCASCFSRSQTIYEFKYT